MNGGHASLLGRFGEANERMTSTIIPYILHGEPLSLTQQVECFPISSPPPLKELVWTTRPLHTA
eukprot:1139125-Pelagomonas_calceolata.AAC.10